MDAQEVNTIVDEEEDNWITLIIKCLEEGIWLKDENKARNLPMKISQYVIEEGVLLKKILIGSYVKVRRTAADELCDTGEGPSKVKFVILAIDYFTKWMEAKLLAKTIGKEVKKFVWENTVCRFGLSRVIITKNETQLVKDSFKSWCEKSKIKHMNTTVAHPHANGLVEMANKSLMHGLKARLGRDRAECMDELPNVLWAQRMMLKTSNEETPFSLTYESEAIILAGIGMPTFWTIQFIEARNE
nr:protein NYNRIN-like [Tanacetum cinerariifolium]